MPDGLGNAGRSLAGGSHFFDDIEIGDSFETGSTEVTAEVIRRFAALSGDNYALHLDDEVAKEMGFPALIAHGILIMALADGLKFGSPVQLDAVASLGWDIRFAKPVFAGDVISARITVEGKRGDQQVGPRHRHLGIRDQEPEWRNRATRDQSADDAPKFRQREPSCGRQVNHRAGCQGGERRKPGRR